MLIYRHLVIMAHSGKLSNIIGLEKCEVYTTKKANIAFALALTHHTTGCFDDRLLTKMTDTGFYVP